MNTARAVPELHAALQPVSRRLAYIVLLEGGAAGFLFAVAIAIAGWMGRWQPVFIVTAGVVAAVLTVLLLMILSLRRRRQLPFVAQLIERKTPGCRNLLVTASELAEQRLSVRPEIAARVQRDAAKLAASLKPEQLFPARNAIVALTASAALWTLFLIAVVAFPSFPVALLGATGESAVIASLDVSIVAPEYSGRATQQIHNPDRIEALAGSRIRVFAVGIAASVTIETLAGTQTLQQGTAGEFSGELIADADGFIALEPTAPDGRKGGRRLIGLTVIPDHPPVAHLTAPGRDLFIPDSRRTIDLTMDASDDLGLLSLRLRYTRVSGAGEQFTFSEGEVPLTITKTDSKKWLAQGRWNLDSLRLAPGDIVVYRAVVADNRPGAAASESDTFIVEITGPGALAAGGFSIDEEQDRYAISQQMVILKTERLLARKPAMTADAYGLESNDIAAEQRKVRAEFVFMMGGELADEIAPDLTGTGDLDERAHAAMDDEAISGRLANNGRLDLVRALRSMSRASAQLTSADLVQALVAEKEALTFLQRAFSRTRYILRTLTERERLDQARRLTGVMTGAASDRRPTVESHTDSSIASLRAVLADVATIAGSSDLRETESARVLSLAQTVLQVDATIEPLQRVAAALTSASRDVSAGRAATARQLLDEAASGLANFIRTTLPSAPQTQPAFESGVLNGALIDALRRPGSSR